MRHTVVGVFDRYAAAEQAARSLAASGIDEHHVHLTRPAGDKAFEPVDDDGVMAHVRSFFAELFGPDEVTQVGHYARAVQRGGAVVRVEVDEEAQAAVVQQALQQAGAVDVDDEDDDERIAGPMSDTGVADGGVRVYPRAGGPSTVPSGPSSADTVAAATPGAVAHTDEALLRREDLEPKGRP
jgi:hypothetical protein